MVFRERRDSFIHETCNNNGVKKFEYLACLGTRMKPIPGIIMLLLGERNYTGHTYYVFRFLCVSKIDMDMEAKPCETNGGISCMHPCPRQNTT